MRQLNIVFLMFILLRCNSQVFASNGLCSSILNFIGPKKSQVLQLSEAEYFDLIHAQSIKVVDMMSVYGREEIANVLSDLVSEDGKNWNFYKNSLTEDLEKSRRQSGQVLSVNAGIFFMSTIAAIAAGANVTIHTGSTSSGVIAGVGYTLGSLAFQGLVGDLMRPNWMALVRNYIKRIFNVNSPDYRSQIQQASRFGTAIVLRIPGNFVAQYRNINIADAAGSLSIKKELDILKQDSPFVFRPNLYQQFIRPGSLDLVFSIDKIGNPKLFISVTVLQGEDQVIGRYSNINDILKETNKFLAK